MGKCANDPLSIRSLGLRCVTTPGGAMHKNIRAIRFLHLCIPLHALYKGSTAKAVHGRFAPVNPQTEKVLTMSKNRKNRNPLPAQVSTETPVVETAIAPVEVAPVEVAEVPAEVVEVAPAATDTLDVFGPVVHAEVASPAKGKKKYPREGGKCWQVWNACDVLAAAGTYVTVKHMREHAQEHNWNVSNAQQEFYAWKKFHNSK